MQTNYHYQKCKTIKTNTRILTFNRLQLPSFINIGYLRVGVENYIHSPLRCTICQTFGHHFSVEITVPSVTYAVYVYLFHYPKYQVCPQHRVKKCSSVTARPFPYHAFPSPAHFHHFTLPSTTPSPFTLPFSPSPTPFPLISFPSPLQSPFPSFPIPLYFSKSFPTPPYL